MNLQTKKLDLIEWLLQLQDQSIIDKIETLKQKTRVSNYEQRLIPMSHAEFLARINAAEDDIREGRIISHEELDKESENW